MARALLTLTLICYFVVLVVAASMARGGRLAGCTYNTATRAICKVFGPYRYEALRVAGCESGYSIWARNGQYLGLFQMGTHERALFAGRTYAYSAWEQARAARRYFDYARRRRGYGWAPWACRP